MGSLTTVWIALLISIVVGTNGHQQATYGEIEETAIEIVNVVETEAPETTSVKRRTPVLLREVPADIYESSSVEEEIEEVIEETAEINYPLYTVNGHLLDESLQEFLYSELSANGIDWWMPYAMMQMYLESAFKIYDVTNGLDYGILQYRKKFWGDKCARYGLPDADIFDPYAQIHVYVQETRKRLIEYGLDVCETISRHKTSDYGSYDSAYVHAVLDHRVERIR